MELTKGRFREVVSSGRSCSKKGCGAAAVDGVSEGIELFKSDVPATGKDIGGEFTPVCRGVEIIVRGKHSEMVQPVSSAAVVPVRVLELAKIIEGSDLLERELEHYSENGQRGIGGRRTL